MPTIDWNELPNSIKAAIIGAVGACATVVVLLVTGVPGTGGDDAGVDAGVDAGAEQTDTCTSKRYTCTTYTAPPSRFKPDAGPPYVPLIVLGQKCTQPDGGTYKTLPVYTHETYVDENFCVEGMVQDGDETVLPLVEPIGVDNHGCACKKDRFCSVILPNDGGVKTAPWGETLPYQGFQGQDCYPKVCVEIAGISSWPEQCPLSKPTDAGFEDE